MAYYNPVRPAYIEDPYPSLAQLRRQEPVHHSPDLNGWVLTTYELCDRVLHDDAAFSSDPVHARGGMGDSVAAGRGRGAPGRPGADDGSAMHSPWPDRSGGRVYVRAYRHDGQCAAGGVRDRDLSGER